MTDRELEELWEDFGDIPVSEDGEYIDEDFHIWSTGESKIDIWHWFDKMHSQGLVKGLMLKRST